MLFYTLNPNIPIEAELRVLASHLALLLLFLELRPTDDALHRLIVHEFEKRCTKIPFSTDGYNGISFI